MSRMASLPPAVLFAAAAAILTGLGGLWEASSYPFGTPRIIGPAVFPFILSLILVGTGIGIIAEGIAARKRGEAEISAPPASIVTILAILGGPAAFAVIVGLFGLVPAIIIAVAISSIPERERSLLSVLLLGAGLAAGCSIVFVWLLKLPLEPFLWPW